MNKIEYMRFAQIRGYRVLGIRDDEKLKAYTVSERTYKSFGSPEVKSLIDDDAFDVFKKEDELYRARVKAGRILEFADNSHSMLVYKLQKAGFKRSIAEAVTDEMQARGYINEERALSRLIRIDVLTNCTSRRRLLLKYGSKGYSRSTVENVIDSLVLSGEIDFEEAKKALIRRKLGDNPDGEEVKKLLYNHGYTVW